MCNLIWGYPANLEWIVFALKEQETKEKERKRERDMTGIETHEIILFSLTQSISNRFNLLTCLAFFPVVSDWVRMNMSAHLFCIWNAWPSTRELTVSNGGTCVKSEEKMKEENKRIENGSEKNALRYRWARRNGRGKRGSKESHFHLTLLILTRCQYTCVYLDWCGVKTACRS